mgnify:CR=1 FL=1
MCACCPTMLGTEGVLLLLWFGLWRQASFFVDEYFKMLRQWDFSQQLKDMDDGEEVSVGDQQHTSLAAFLGA